MSTLHARSVLSTTFVLLLALAGCSKESNPVEATISWRRPGVGTTYSFLAYQSTDSTGRPLPDSSQSNVRSITNTVLESGRSYMGVANLVAVSDAGSVLLLDYRSNGDLAFTSEHADTSKSQWIVLPVGTRSTIAMPERSDILVDAYGDTVWSTITVTAAYGGSDTMMVGSGSLPVHRVDVVSTIRETGGFPTEASSRTVYWVAPSIGFFVKRARPSWGGPSGSYSVLALTGYAVR